jgi:hypothetical protein
MIPPFITYRLKDGLVSSGLYSGSRKYNNASDSWGTNTISSSLQNLSKA